MGWNYLSIPKLQRFQHWNLEMDKWFHPTLYWACNYLSMLESKFIHVNRSSPMSHFTQRMISQYQKKELWGEWENHTWSESNLKKNKKKKHNDRKQTRIIIRKKVPWNDTICKHVFCLFFCSLSFFLKQFSIKRLIMAFYIVHLRAISQKMLYSFNQFIWFF